MIGGLSCPNTVVEVFNSCGKSRTIDLKYSARVLPTPQQLAEHSLTLDLGTWQTVFIGLPYLVLMIEIRALERDNCFYDLQLANNRSGTAKRSARPSHIIKREPVKSD